MFSHVETSLNKISPQWFGSPEGSVNVGPKIIWSSLGSLGQWPGPPRSTKESVPWDTWCHGCIRKRQPVLVDFLHSKDMIRWVSQFSLLFQLLDSQICTRQQDNTYRQRYSYPKWIFNNIASCTTSTRLPKTLDFHHTQN